MFIFLFIIFIVLRVECIIVIGFIYGWYCEYFKGDIFVLIVIIDFLVFLWYCLFELFVMYNI